MSTTPKSQTPTADLVAALAELDNVKANKVNPGFKNRYVSLDALLDAIKPVLLSHNLALIQTLISEEGKVGINTAFLHASGERFDFGRLMVKAEGLDAQKIGGAITYIRRQSIQTACGISVDLDDDGAVAASSFRSAAASQSAPAFSPTPRPLTKLASPTSTPSTPSPPRWAPCTKAICFRLNRPSRRPSPTLAINSPASWRTSLGLT